MPYRDTTARIAEFRREIAEIRKKMRHLQATIEPEEVSDYTLKDMSGPVRLSQLFADKADLIAIHSMGIACPYCTLWADGYNGVYDHLASRAAFVIVGPDAPTAQQAFAEERGWRFRLVSHAGTSFAQDLGFRSERGAWLPGLSVLKREGERIFRVADAEAKPGDDFNPVPHIFDLLPGGAGDWIPRLHYHK